MEVVPRESEVFLLGDADRRIVSGGPALIGADGSRYDIPPNVYEVMEFVEAAMGRGFAVQVTALRHELPVNEAAGVIGMSVRDFRSYVADGEIPFRSSQYVDWVRLSDVLAFDERLRAQRRQALDAMFSESAHDDDDLPDDRDR